METKTLSGERLIYFFGIISKRPWFDVLHGEVLKLSRADDRRAMEQDEFRMGQKSSWKSWISSERSFELRKNLKIKIET